MAAIGAPITMLAKTLMSIAGLCLVVAGSSSQRDDPTTIGELLARAARV